MEPANPSNFLARHSEFTFLNAIPQINRQHDGAWRRKRVCSLETFGLPSARLSAQTGFVESLIAAQKRHSPFVLLYMFQPRLQKCSKPFSCCLVAEMLGSRTKCIWKPWSFHLWWCGDGTGWALSMFAEAGQVPELQSAWWESRSLGKWYWPQTELYFIYGGMAGTYPRV